VPTFKSLEQFAKENLFPTTLAQVPRVYCPTHIGLPPMDHQAHVQYFRINIVMGYNGKEE